MNKDLFDSIQMWVRDRFINDEDVGASILKCITDEVEDLKIIDKNFANAPGSRYSFRLIHLARLLKLVYAYVGENSIELERLIEAVEDEHKESLTKSYLDTMKEKDWNSQSEVVITAKRDKTTHRIEEGKESYEYFFLFSTKFNEGVKIDDFISSLKTATRIGWRYKEQCECGNYILHGKFFLAETMKEFPEEIKFHMTLDFTPYPLPQIKVL